jgi:hypothetical protein
MSDGQHSTRSAQGSKGEVTDPRGHARYTPTSSRAAPPASVFDPSQWPVLGWRYAFQMFEVVIIERGPTLWEWQVCKSEGVRVMEGRAKTRAEAKYQGNRALFSLLAGGPKPMTLS